MKNLYGILFLSISILLVSGCGNNEPDKNSGGKNEVYITAGLKYRPLTNVKFKSTPERIARGEYLTNGASHCFLCHSIRDHSKPGAPPIESMKGGGAILINEKNFRIVAPNITSDKETGAGNWTDDMFARAIREGIGHDGRALYPLMLYYDAFKYFSDEDIASIVVYLRTLPPVENKLPKRKIPLEVQKAIVHYPRPIYKPIPNYVFKNEIDHGKFLVEIGDCAGCHTAWESQTKPGIFAGGLLLPEDSSYSANITPDKSGITYDENTFINVIRTGKNGSLHSIMPWIAIKNYSDSDLRAIYKYLRTVKPVRHYVNNIDKPTYCALCGGTHGLGEMNKAREIKPVKMKSSVFKEFEGTYTSDIGDSITVFCSGDSLMMKNEVEGFTTKLLPVSTTEFASNFLPYTLKFARDSKNHVTDFTYHKFDDVDCRKVK